MWIYFLKRQLKTRLAFEVFGERWAQLGIQECRTGWEHLRETGISHSWGYYEDASLEYKTSHVNTDFHRAKYNNWAVSTYFKSASPVLSSLAAEWGGWPSADDHVGGMSCHVFINSHSGFLWSGFFWVLTVFCVMTDLLRIYCWCWHSAYYLACLS